MVRNWTYMTLPWFVDTIRQEISNIDLVITTLFAVAWRLLERKSQVDLGLLESH